MNREEMIEDLLANMQSMQRAWKMRMYGAMGKESLSPAQIGILFHLRHSQPVSGRKLAATLQMTPSSITQFIDGLDQLGYITREQDQQDRRIVYLGVSKKGEEKIKNLEERRKEYFKKFTETLSDEELMTMARIQKKMAQQLEIWQEKETKI